MATEKLKLLLDFDGTLTDEQKQADELVNVALEMLARVLVCQPAELEAVYAETKTRILSHPHLYSWEINSLPACYAYEGPYLLNTVILQQIIATNPRFTRTIENRYPAGKIDSITQCVNYLFHEGSLGVNPHFLPDAHNFLISLLEHPTIEPVIMTNSETRKVRDNLNLLSIGERGQEHPYDREIGILGDTRQYFLDHSWKQTFDHPTLGPIQVLPINDLFTIELRRPVYYHALQRIAAEGYHSIVVVADGFSLAGALPLIMGHRFVFLKTAYAPIWAENFVANQPEGRVVANLDEAFQAIT